MKHLLARRLAAWLIAVTAFAALQPALAAVAAGVQGTRPAQVELCTSHGMQWVSVDTKALTADPSEPSPPQLAASAATDHCPLCRVIDDVLVDAVRDDLRFAVPAGYALTRIGGPPPFSPADRVVQNAPARAPPARG